MTTYHHGNLKNALLERASEVIESKGVQAVSLRALARDLGVSETAPARHFKSRADLFLSLAMAGYSDATKEIAASKPMKGRSSIHAMALAFVHWVADNPSLAATIIHPDVNRHADLTLQAAMAQFAELVRDAVLKAHAEGWRADQDPEWLFQYTLAAMRGIASNLTDPLFSKVIGSKLAVQAENVVDVFFA